jgi:hypothetical protein
MMRLKIGTAHFGVKTLQEGQELCKKLRMDSRYAGRIGQITGIGRRSFQVSRDGHVSEDRQKIEQADPIMLWESQAMPFGRHGASCAAWGPGLRSAL